MYEEAETATCWLLMAVWACLNSGQWVAQVFAQILWSMEELEKIMQIADIHICKGLYEVIRAKAPPTLAWVRSLPPIENYNRWAVYILILDKADC